MRKTFATLDDTLIERLFQPALALMAHKIGCGRTAAACFCLDAASLSWIVSRVPGLADSVSACDVSAASWHLLVVLLGLSAMISVRILFQRAAAKAASPLRAMMQPHRGVMLLMLVARLVQSPSPDLTTMADLAMLLCAITGLYLGACAEQPPLRRVCRGLLSAG